MTTDTSTTAAINAVLLDPEYETLLAQLVTEDDTPVDNFYSAKHQRLLVETLNSSWEGPAGHRRFLVDANVGVFVSPKKPPLVPDVFVSLDVAVEPHWHEKHNRSYFLWHFHKPPDVVIEIVSNREGGEDSSKLQAYAEMGVAYYAIFDPEDYLRQGVLRCYALHEGHYQLQEEAWFAGVALGLTLWYGEYEYLETTWLRWCDREGVIIPTGAERAEWERREKEWERDQKERERRQREAALSDLERERQQREAALSDLERERQEKARLLAKLRELGASLDEEDV
jgi:Uma2 family endonuclease